MLELQKLRRRLHFLLITLYQLPALGGGVVLLFLLAVVLMGGNLKNLSHVFLDGLGHDAVVKVIFLLYGPPALGLSYGVLHGGRDAVGVHYHLAFGVAGGASDGLYQAPAASQEAFFVRVQDGDQGDLGQIQALPQKVYAHQHIELPKAQIPYYLHALHGVYIVVHIPHFYAVILKIACKVFSHLLC